MSKKPSVMDSWQEIRSCSKAAPQPASLPLQNEHLSLLTPIYGITDVLCALAAWVLAYGVRFNTVFDTPKGIPSFELYALMLPFIGLIWIGVNFLSGLYRRSAVRRSAVYEAMDLIRCMLISGLLFISFTYFYTDYRYSRLTLLFFFTFSFIFTVISRSMVRKISRRLFKRRPKKKTLICFSWDQIEQVRRFITRPSIANYTQNLFVVLRPPEDIVMPEGFWAIDRAEEFDFVGFSITQQIQHGVFFLDKNRDFFDSPQFSELTNQIPDLNIFLPIPEIAKINSHLEYSDGQLQIGINDTPLKGPQIALKRMVDIAGALFALTIFSPLMAVISILIKLESKGPIIYEQERLTQNGNRFKMYKFRSMTTDSEKETGAVFAQKEDARKTKIGNLLRKTSLDELPQFCNVLFGDMSLVGPRPERPVFVEQFRKEIPGYMIRHKVKSGITGLAQVNGYRGNTSIKRRIEQDIEYIQKWSLWLDIKLMFKTVLKGFINKNAY